MSVSTKIYTILFGKLIGIDELGNKYYESSHKRWFKKHNRWVIYSKNNFFIANISSKWFKWLHYLSDTPPMKLKKKYNWMMECGMTQYDTVDCKASKVVYDGTYDSWNYKKRIR